MEIKLNAGDKISIPTGCKATIEDDLIVIEENKEEFKNGDILHSKTIDKIVIFKAYTDEFKRVFQSHYNNLGEHNYNWSTHAFRHATEDEKQAFFDELRAKGLRWNAEAKTMEKFRRRAKIGEFYLYIGRDGEVFEAR